MDNKWCLITSADLGLGPEIAIYMAKSGYNLVLHARKKDSLRDLKLEVVEYNVNCILTEAKLDDNKDVRKMLGSVLVDISVIFNNACVRFDTETNYLLQSDKDYSRSFLFNATTPLTICYYFLPKMIKNNYGRIINITNVANSNDIGYAASKAALDKISTDIASTLNGTNVSISMVDYNNDHLKDTTVDEIAPLLTKGAFSNKFNGKLINA